MVPSTAQAHYVRTRLVMEGTGTRSMRLRPATRRLRLAWRAHLGLAFGFMGTGLVTLVALTLLIDRDMVPACEAVTPAPPNFDVAPVCI